jgi:hypothetical protein
MFASMQHADCHAINIPEANFERYSILSPAMGVSSISTKGSILLLIAAEQRSNSHHDTAHAGTSNAVDPSEQEPASSLGAISC